MPVLCKMPISFDMSDASLGMIANDVVLGIEHFLHSGSLEENDRSPVTKLAELLDLPDGSNGFRPATDAEHQLIILQLLHQSSLDDSEARRFARALRRALAAPVVAPIAAQEEDLRAVSNFASRIGEAMLSRTTANYHL
jgi:hypothetical protein